MTEHQSGQRPKLHHYVPKLLLRRFSDPREQVYFLDQSTQNTQPRKTSISNILSENYLYAQKHSDGSKDFELEEQFSEVESTIAPLIERIDKSIQHDKFPTASPGEYAMLIDFLFLQWRRVPEFQLAVASVEDFERSIENILTQFESHVRPLTDDERKYYSDRENISRLRHNTFIDLLKKEDGNARAALKARGIAFGTPERKNCSFITGSFPVLKLTPPNDSSLLNPLCEVWLPLSPRLSICSYGGFNGEVVKMPTWMVRKNNLSICKQSRFIVSHSYELLRSLQSPKY